MKQEISQQKDPEDQKNRTYIIKPKISEEQARRIMQAYLKKFPMLVRYRKNGN